MYFKTRKKKSTKCVVSDFTNNGANNKELRQLYDYLKTRENNPLKKMQALVVISKKVLTLIFTLSKKRAYYEPELVFGSFNSPYRFGKSQIFFSVRIAILSFKSIFCIILVIPHNLYKS